MDQPSPSDIHNPEELLEKLQKLNEELEQNAKLLVRRDLELTELNDRYYKQLREFKILQEATILANQTRSVKAMYERVGVLLVNRLNYDRFFVFDRINDHFNSFVNIGFDSNSIKAITESFGTFGEFKNFFSQKQVRIFQSNGDETDRHISQSLGVSSSVVGMVTTNNFEAILGVCMNESLDAFTQDDVDFIELLIGQLDVIVDNSYSFEQLERQNLELKQLDRAKTTFLSIASHQLRTPLAIMKLALSIMLDQRTGQLNQKQREILDDAVESNERIIKLVNKLLNVTRLEQRRIHLNLDNIDVSEIIKLILVELEPHITIKKVIVKTELPDKVLITGDRSFIRESLMNIVANGIKYNKDYGTLLIRANQDKNQTTITFQDTGIGMRESDKKRLFSQFYRSPEATKMDPNGTGLGLFTARQFIRLHHGDIKIESKFGKGTTVVVTLPNQHQLNHTSSR